MNRCLLGPASFKALVEAAWSALASFNAGTTVATPDYPLALGAAAFAGFPALEELVLPTMLLDDSGAALLSRHWPLLTRLDLCRRWLADGVGAGVAALARGEWLALKTLRMNARVGPLTLEVARRWAPALEASAAAAPGE